MVSIYIKPTWIISLRQYKLVTNEYTSPVILWNSLATLKLFKTWKNLGSRRHGVTEVPLSIMGHRNKGVQKKRGVWRRGCAVQTCPALFTTQSVTITHLHLRFGSPSSILIVCSWSVNIKGPSLHRFVHFFFSFSFECCMAFLCPQSRTVGDKSESFRQFLQHPLWSPGCTSAAH